jgi:hypothetical protein
VPSGDVEREAGEHDDDRGPAEPVADLRRRKAESELEIRIGQVATSTTP